MVPKKEETPDKPNRDSLKDSAKGNAQKAQDMAAVILHTSNLAGLFHSKATVLELEAKNLLGVLKKKPVASPEEEARAQRILRDVMALREEQRAETAARAPAKRKVQIADAPAEVHMMKKSPVDDDESYLRDVKDEEGLALIRRSSIYQPITAATVEQPDEGIAAMVAKTFEEKSSAKQSPALSKKNVRNGSSSPTPKVAKKPFAAPPLPKTSATTSARGHSQRPPREAVSKKENKESNLRATPTHGSPVSTRKPSPEASRSQLLAVRDKKAHPVPKITASMAREKRELHDVIQTILKMAEKEQIPEPSGSQPAAAHGEALLPTSVHSYSRSVDTEIPLSSLRRSLRKNPIKFFAKACCSLALLALVLGGIGWLLAYRYRPSSKLSAKLREKTSPHKSNRTSIKPTTPTTRHTPQNRAGNLLSSLPPVQELATRDLNGTNRTNVEVPVNHDEILHVS